MLEAIPILGPILGAVPAILVGFGLGWQTALCVVAANVTIAQIESYLLVPRVMDRSVGVHPVVTLLAITSLFALLGPVGGVLAIPVAAIVQLLLRRFVLARDANDRHIEDGHRDRASVLLYKTRELLDDLHAQQGERNYYPGDACPGCASEVVQQVAHQLSGVLRSATGEGRSP